MKETKKLFVKLRKDNLEYSFTHEQLTQSFVDAMAKIYTYFEDKNKVYAQKAEEFVAKLNNIDFVLVNRAFIRYANAVKHLLLEPFSEDVVKCINRLLYDLEIENIEKHLSPTITQEEKQRYLDNLKQFDDYKNFICVFVNHIYCYLRFYYKNLEKKYYFNFDYLVAVCYENKNIEKLNETLLKICNKHCKRLVKYVPNGGKSNVRI